MRIVKLLLPLLALLIGSAAARADYDPSSPPEPGVYFQLTTRCIPKDAGYSMTSSGTHPFGSKISMRVSANTGYRFIRWEDEDGNEVSANSSFTYTMPTRDVTLTARFEYTPASPGEPATPEFSEYSDIRIQIFPSGAGSVSGSSSGSYKVGSTQSFTVYANSGYKFSNWTSEGYEIGTSRTLSYTVPKGDRVLVANFEYDPSSPGEPGIPQISRKLTLKTNMSGAMSSVYGAGTYFKDQRVRVYGYVNTYYTFVNWTDENGEVVSDKLDFYYDMPDRNVTLTANFTYYYDPSSPGEPGIPNPDGSIAENMVLWPRFGMADDTHVQILCETPGSTIHYTLDGTDPTSESPVYTEPVYVSSNLLVKAIAFKEGMEHSPIVSFQVTSYHASTPVFTFENRKIKITSDTPGAVIRYTLDYTDPNTESEVYTTPLEPEENCRIKAYASKEGLTDSPISLYVYRRAEHTLPAPTFELTEDDRLIIIPAVTGGTTRYTIDGTEPDENSTVYKDPILLTRNVTVKAYTSHVNYFDSPAGEFKFDRETVPTPTASFSDLKLTLSCADTNAEIFYTTDGKAPTSASTKYETPVALTQDCTVKFFATRKGYNDSEVGTFEFKRSNYQVAKPAISYVSGTKTLTITCATTGAEIRYTIDGTVPTATTGTVYKDQIKVDGNKTYTARAFKSGMFESDTETCKVSDQQVPKPTASFSDLKLTLRCADANAAIFYTTDGNAPTSASTKYSAPVALTKDCTVKFFATRSGYNDSDVATFEFKRSNYQVAKPAISYDPETKILKMECATDGAQIRYTTDGKVPTATTGTVYENQIKVEGNKTYTARAFKSGMFESDTETCKVSDQQVPKPTASFADLKLTLRCADTNAAIFYTTDGKAPASSSTKYETPVALTQDCTVKFIATRSGYNDSEEATFEFKRASYQVAKPAISYVSGTKTLTITCATDGAQIRYTTDGKVPTATTGTVYENQIKVDGNKTYTARAFKAGLFESETETCKVSGQKVPKPTAKYAAHSVTLHCDDTKATIHYTIDGTQPSEKSAVYSSPIPMTADCTVRFMASRENFDNSDEDEFKFLLADYQEPRPSLDCIYRNRLVNLFIESDIQTVEVRIDGALYSRFESISMHQIPVTSDMRRLSAMTIASDPDRYDSEETVIDLEFHPAPRLAYDGHAVSLAPGEGERYSGIGYMVSVNGSGPYESDGSKPVEISGFGTVEVTVASDMAFLSDPAGMPIEFFNTGKVAGATNGHRLAEAFGTWGDSAEDYTSLIVKGETDAQDISFLATLPNLVTLHLEADRISGSVPAGVFAGSRLETVSSADFPEGILAGAQRLTSVIWRNDGSRFPEGRLSENGNPNILLWTSDSSLAPSDAMNVVETVGDIYDESGSGLTGSAARVTLQAGHPYNAHRPVEAGQVIAEKTFSHATEIGVCQGWETIALPFDVDMVAHEDKGEIVPFAAWDGEDSSPRPFWLYRASADGWQPADRIEAGVPYIISMPNSPDYIEDFNITGKVRFVSGGNTVLGTEDSMPCIDSWADGLTFEACYMPEDAPARGLNVNGEAGMPCGSVFTEEAPVQLLGGCVRGGDIKKNIPVFGDWSGVITPVVGKQGAVAVDSPAPGRIRVLSMRDMDIAVVTPGGALAARLHVKAGEPAEVGGLTRGIYIVAGIKLTVK